jgi:hypothetical protein
MFFFSNMLKPFVTVCANGYRDGHNLPVVLEDHDWASMVGTRIGFQGQGAGRPIVVFKYHGEVMPISISVGTNGFIVSLNIVSKDLFLESDIDEDDLAEWP